MNGAAERVKVGTNSYLPIKLLGSGTYGSAYLVRDEETDTPWVLKVVIVPDSSQVAAVAAPQEVQVMTNLRHPMLVRLRHSCLAPIRGHPREFELRMVLNYCAGGTLKDLTHWFYKPTPIKLNENQLLSVFAQIALGIDYMHMKRCLHRDIKSDNIFLWHKPSSFGNIRIMLGDMGISRHINPASGELAETFCGTPLYMAPELVRKGYGFRSSGPDGYDFKADVWSLGVLLYEMYCGGRYPFWPNDPVRGDPEYDQHRRMKEMQNRIMTIAPHPFPPEAPIRPDVRSLLWWMLEKHPSKRPSVADVLMTDVLMPYTREALGSALAYVQEVSKGEKVGPGAMGPIQACVQEANDQVRRLASLQEQGKLQKCPVYGEIGPSKSNVPEPEPQIYQPSFARKVNIHGGANAVSRSPSPPEPAPKPAAAGGAKGSPQSQGPAREPSAKKPSGDGNAYVRTPSPTSPQQNAASPARIQAQRYIDVSVVPRPAAAASPSPPEPRPSDGNNGVRVFAYDNRSSQANNGARAASPKPPSRTPPAPAPVSDRPSKKESNQGQRQAPKEIFQFPVHSPAPAFVRLASPVQSQASNGSSLDSGSSVEAPPYKSPRVSRGQKSPRVKAADKDRRAMSDTEETEDDSTGAAVPKRGFIRQMLNGVAKILSREPSWSPHATPPSSRPQSPLSSERAAASSRPASPGPRVGVLGGALGGMSPGMRPRSPQVPTRVSYDKYPSPSRAPRPRSPAIDPLPRSPSSRDLPRPPSPGLAPRYISPSQLRPAASPQYADHHAAPQLSPAAVRKSSDIAPLGPPRLSPSPPRPRSPLDRGPPPRIPSPHANPRSAAAAGAAANVNLNGVMDPIALKRPVSGGYAARPRPKSPEIVKGRVPSRSPSPPLAPVSPSRVRPASPIASPQRETPAAIPRALSPLAQKPRVQMSPERAGHAVPVPPPAADRPSKSPRRLAGLQVATPNPPGAPAPSAPVSPHKNQQPRAVPPSHPPPSRLPIAIAAPYAKPNLFSFEAPTADTYPIPVSVPAGVGAAPVAPAAAPTRASRASPPARIPSQIAQKLSPRGVAILNKEEDWDRPRPSDTMEALDVIRQAMKRPGPRSRSPSPLRSPAAAAKEAAGRGRVFV